MMLAEALVLRADCQKRIAQLKVRLERCAKVQDGEDAPENAVELLAELKSVINNLSSLVKKINKTNSVTSFNDNQTLADALAERDAIALERDALEELIEYATIKYDRYARSEIKYISKINIADTQKVKDELSKKYRELDFKIQQRNYNVELVD